MDQNMDQTMDQNMNKIINVCQVRGCRNKNDHVTSRHCCGNEYCCITGHGKVECGNTDLVSELRRFDGNIIAIPCEIEDCLDPYTHTTKGHSCLFCDGRMSKHIRYCPSNLDIEQPLCIYDDYTIMTFNKSMTEEIRNIHVDIGTYTIVYGGMGSIWYIRRTHTGDKQYLIMCTDDWGQYGKEISRLPIYKQFVFGYKEL